MITAKELASKRHLIQSGMEFQILNHQKTIPLTIRVTNVKTLNKTSCWGEYEKETVWFDTICQASKRKFVNKQRPDGSTYTDIEWVPNPGVFYTDKGHMSLAGFIEYKLNKKI
jgi:hypothetical protein